MFNIQYSKNMLHEKIAILDFGGQYAHLIADRIRRLGVYSEIRDSDTPITELKKYKGLILSGGPMSVHDEQAPPYNREIFNLNVPILGICYGHQLMQHLLGGEVVTSTTKEYGIAELDIQKSIDIFKELEIKSRVWMSHGDTVQKLAPGFAMIGQTADCIHAAVANIEKKFYGVQFHPEVTHTEQGTKMLNQFLDICKVKRDWSIEQFMEEEIEIIKEKIGDKKVFLLVSGGVDSTVCFALLEKALGKNRVYGLLVDHGLMRLNEAPEVKEALNKIGFKNLHVTNKSNEFFTGLKNKTDPEEKRKIIGELFWQVKEDVAEELNLNPDEWIMGQGTIYPDTIETGGTKHADTIKTHHNRVDLVQEMIAAGKVIEPIAQLYKDEVRELGEKLGLPKNMVWRQPFPGPGLGVRILCADQTEKLEDFNTINQQIKDFIQQNFDIEDINIQVLPIQSVGVQGDGRTYRHPAVLFTKSQNWDLLEKISTAITNNFSAVNRVILRLKGEPGDFILKASDINSERVNLLQRTDNIVNNIMNDAPEDYDIWQFPVVLIPTSTQSDLESIVLRPVVSTEAMTANFARIDWNILDQITTQILTEKEITHVFYDITHKPPGTIEWE